MNKRVSLACTLALLLAGPALAQDAPALHEGHLNTLDAEQSGSVSQAEYQSFMQDAFATLDANGDGVLVESEASVVLSPEQFGQTDANRDGRVTRQEFMNQVMGDFAAGDRDRDGQLN